MNFIFLIHIFLEFLIGYLMCDSRTKASVPAFQAGDAGSIPVYRSMEKANSTTEFKMATKIL